MRIPAAVVMPTEPVRNTFDLPFMVPLEPGTYEHMVKGERVMVEHEFVRQQHLDPRLGIAGGQFGLQRDQLGLVRYSRVRFQLEAEQVARLARAFFGGVEHRPDLSPDNIRVRVAAAVCNHFVDVFRATLDEPDVHRVGDGDLMLFRYQSGHRRTTLRAYGGTPRLEVIGLQPAAHERLLAALSNGQQPAAWDLAALDASRAIRDGRIGDGIASACTALESGLDVYFARVWRRTRTPTSAAIVDIGVRPDNRLRTIDDVLAEAGVRRKLDRYAVRENLSQEQQDTLSNAIDLRNLVIHAGAQLDPEQHSLTARRAVDFVRGDLKSIVEALAQPRLADLVYGYEEAVGGRCPARVARVVREFVTTRGLQARLHNRHARRGEMVSNEVGNLLVVYISFGGFSQDDIDLFIARAAMNHWLRHDATMPAAHVSEDLPFEENRPFFSSVARELTYAVWDVAIDQHLRRHGFSTAIRANLQRRAGELTTYYAPSTYVVPAWQELRQRVEYIRLARVAACLRIRDARRLIRTARRVNRETAEKAEWSLAALRSVRWGSADSIREAMVRLHDAAGYDLLASVLVFDPRVRRFFGAGVPKAGTASR